MTHIKQEIYVSSTLGEIPLSFTGRHLMQSLREAIVEALPENREYIQALSIARGKLAEYISSLERRLNKLDDLSSISTIDLTRELIKRLESKSPGRVG